jgi:hypothetical protein
MKNCHLILYARGAPTRFKHILSSEAADAQRKPYFKDFNIGIFQYFLSFKIGATKHFSNAIISQLKCLNSIGERKKKKSLHLKDLLQETSQ